MVESHSLLLFFCFIQIRQPEGLQLDMISEDIGWCLGDLRQERVNVENAHLSLIPSGQNGHRLTSPGAWSLLFLDLTPDP